MRAIDRQMTRPIFVGYEPKGRARAPIEFALEMARLTGAPVIVASVQAGPPVLPISTPGVPYAVGRMDEDLVADCSEALAVVDADLRAAGTPVECRKLEGTSAAGALHEVVEAEDALMLVVGSNRSRTVEKLVLGSTAQRLLHGAPCPVAVVPLDRDRRRLETIGVAYVSDDEGREALRTGYALARLTGAKLRALTVVRVTPSMYAQVEAGTEGRFGKSLEDVEGEYKLLAERELRRAVEELGDGVEVEIDAFVGDPADTLVELSRGLDLLVSGSRGYGPLRAVLLGSVSRRLAAQANCPVLVLPRGVRSPLADLTSAEAAAPA
jgi:nucleotide-binding universal stress UspA family protein